MSSPNCPICQKPWTKKISTSDKNPNRVYNTCDNCYVEKPTEWWCWDNEKPSAIKVDSVKKAIKKRKLEEGSVEISAPSSSSGELETQMKELKEILLRIEEMLKKEYQ